jgi:hypothetical protein
MPFWIEGWVEVTSLDDTTEEWAWQSLMTISPLVDVADEVSERLFGLSKKCVTGQSPVVPLFAGRGIPPNPSKEVQRDLEEIIELERKYGPGEIGGYTHATWREIKSTNILSVARPDSDWRLVFDLVQRIEQDYRFSDEKIRFIVWFNW